MRSISFTRRAQRIRGARAVAVLFALASALAGCGGGDEDRDDSLPVVLGQPGPGDAGRHHPVEVGNVWRYEVAVTEVGSPTRFFRSTVESTGTRPVAGGATATVFLQTDEDAFGGTAESVVVSDANGVAEFADTDALGVGGPVGPYWLLRFPLAVGSSFVQLDRTGLALGQDFDGDGRSESFDIRSVVSVLAVEEVTVPAGTFPAAVKVATVADLAVVASGTGQRVGGRVVSTSWYAPGIGRVRGVDEITVDGELVETDRYELLGYEVNGRTGGVVWTGPAPTRLEATPPAVEVNVAGTAAVSVSAWSDMAPLTGVPVSWQSANPAVATVSADGVVTGVAPGTTVVHARYGSVQSNPVSVQVLAGRRLALAANDLAYDALRGRLYASVPSRQGAQGNSVAVIDPASGVVLSTLPAGSEPNKLAMSGDGRFLYVALDGAAKVTRFDLAAPGGPLQDLTFAVGSDVYGPMYVEDMDVMPGAPGTIAISRRHPGVSPRHAGVGIYDGGVMRPNTTQGHTGSNVIEFGSVPSRLYGLNNETTEFGFRRLRVDASGVVEESVASGFGQNFGGDIEYAAGIVYGTRGTAVDPELGSLLGTFAAGRYGGPVEPDPARGVVFYLTQPAPDYVPTGWEVCAFDARTFLPLGSVSVRLWSDNPYPGAFVDPRALVRWGARGLAFRTSADEVVLVDDIPGVP